MTGRIPTIGRIVTYNTTAKEREALKEKGCNESKQLPAVIVAVWGSETPERLVNLKVFVDGIGPDLWKTSLPAMLTSADGEQPEGTWNWPEVK